MNQILVTKKLYITPELKRKKKIYKFDFFLSVFLVCILVSVCIYANYERNKNEEISQQILANFDAKEDTTVAEGNILVVLLQEDAQTEGQEDIQEQVKASENKKEILTTKEGFRYSTIATINIPKINVIYPILDGETKSVEETDALLKISPTKFHGPEPNTVGNLCIVGHNYRNSKFFSKVPTLVNGDIIEITDLLGRTVQYKIYDRYEVVPEDSSCTTQLTKGKKEITLITCTEDSKLRVIVKARAI